jgi:hypothetical protein
MQALRVDRPVYPRRLKHNTVAKGRIADGQGSELPSASLVCPMSFPQRGEPDDGLRVLSPERRMELSLSSRRSSSQIRRSPFSSGCG